MGMIINTNIMALNAQRNLGITSMKLSRAMEQLSSGMRINRAADDAAGLAISEKMRSQISGMQQGLRNAQDGISMIQTAEGALSETTAILQRMRELSVQASSTTLSTSDRTAVGGELLALRSQIDNIATQTRFNGQNLLTGSLSTTEAGTLTTATMADGGVNVTAVVDADSADPSHTFTITGTGAALTITDNTTSIQQTINVTDFAAAGTQTLNFSSIGVKVALTSTGVITGAKVVDTGGANPLKGLTLTTTGSGSATYRVGAQTGDNIAVAYTNMQSAALGSGGATNLGTLVADNQTVSTTAKADTLLTAIDDAIGQVSTQRAALGASQNQMQSATNSLGVSIENLTASDSRIRDADIAFVSSELLTRQIMQQAGIAVLAQSNSAPQSVLKLLG